jgi:hypothetical protein
MTAVQMACFAWRKDRDLVSTASFGHIADQTRPRETSPCTSNWGVWLRETLLVWREDVYRYAISLSVNASHRAHFLTVYSSLSRTAYSETTVEVISTVPSKRAQLGKISTKPFPQFHPPLRDSGPCVVKKRVLVGRSQVWKLLSRGRIRSAMGRDVAVDTRSLSLRHTRQAIWTAVWFVIYDTGA